MRVAGESDASAAGSFSSLGAARLLETRRRLILPLVVVILALIVLIGPARRHCWRWRCHGEHDRQSHGRGTGESDSPQRAAPSHRLTTIGTVLEEVYPGELVERVPHARFARTDAKLGRQNGGELGNRVCAIAVLPDDHCVDT